MNTRLSLQHHLACVAETSNKRIHMICPEDHQPCTVDHSRRCFDLCAAQVTARRTAASAKPVPSKLDAEPVVSVRKHATNCRVCGLVLRPTEDLRLIADDLVHACCSEAASSSRNSPGAIAAGPAATVW